MGRKSKEEWLFAKKTKKKGSAIHGNRKKLPIQQLKVSRKAGTTEKLHSYPWPNTNNSAKFISDVPFPTGAVLWAPGTHNH